MKEFEGNGIHKDDSKLSAEERQVKREVHFASMAIRPGHTLFEFDLTNGMVTPAKIESVNASLNKDGTHTVRKKVIRREQALYVSALNLANAHKKFKKMYQQMLADGLITIKPI